MNESYARVIKADEDARLFEEAHLSIQRRVEPRPLGMPRQKLLLSRSLAEAAREGGSSRT